MTEPLDDMLARQGAAFVAGLRKRQPRVATEPKAKKRGTPERDAQKAVVAWLQKAGCIVAASVNEAPADSADPDKRARFYASRRKAGVLNGWPDLTVVTQGGRVFWIEMKSATGRTSAAQDDLHTQLRERGHVVIVGRDIWSVQQGIDQAGIVLGWQAPRMEPLR